eukprot:10405064-Karenia_brevis.AAC.1
MQALDAALFGSSTGYLGGPSPQPTTASASHASPEHFDMVSKIGKQKSEVLQKEGVNVVSLNSFLNKHGPFDEKLQKDEHAKPAHGFIAVEDLLKLR